MKSLTISIFDYNELSTEVQEWVFLDYCIFLESQFFNEVLPSIASSFKIDPFLIRIEQEKVFINHPNKDLCVAFMETVQKQYTALLEKETILQTLRVRKFLEKGTHIPQEYFSP